MSSKSEAVEERGFVGVVEAEKEILERLPASSSLVIASSAGRFSPRELEGTEAGSASWGAAADEAEATLGAVLVFLRMSATRSR